MAKNEYVNPSTIKSQLEMLNNFLKTEAAKDAKLSIEIMKQIRELETQAFEQKGVEVEVEEKEKEFWGKLISELTYSRTHTVEIRKKLYNKRKEEDNSNKEKEIAQIVDKKAYLMHEKNNQRFSVANKKQQAKASNNKNSNSENIENSKNNNVNSNVNIRSKNIKMTEEQKKEVDSIRKEKARVYRLLENKHKLLQLMNDNDYIAFREEHATSANNNRVPIAVIKEKSKELAELGIKQVAVNKENRKQKIARDKEFERRIAEIKIEALNNEQWTMK